MIYPLSNPVQIHVSGNFVLRRGGAALFPPKPPVAACAGGAANATASASIIIGMTVDKTKTYVRLGHSLPHFWALAPRGDRHQ